MKKIISQIKKDWTIYKLFPAPDDHGIILFIFYWIKDYLTPKFCEKFGHKLIDNSHAGPDSGCISAYCKRCGFEFHQQLY